MPTNNSFGQVKVNSLNLSGQILTATANGLEVNGGTIQGGGLGGVTGVSITGGIAISGAINLLAGNNISLTQGGNSNITITSTAVGGSTILTPITGAGTLNFVPKFTTNNSGISNSNIICVGNHVGINVTNPQDNLDISGTVLITNNDSINVLSATGFNATYQQINIQNQSNGQNSSSDLVATSNVGTELTSYVDLGINSSTYSGGYIGYSGDGYLYSQGNDFYIGNPVVGKKLMFFAGNAPTGLNGALMTLENLNQVRVSGNIFASGGQVLTTLNSGALQSQITTLNTTINNLTRSTTFCNFDGIPTGYYVLPMWRAPFNCTVTGIHGYRLSGSNTLINAKKNWANLMVTNLSIANTGAWQSSGIIQNASFVAGDTLVGEIVSVTNFPITVSIQVDFTRP